MRVVFRVDASLQAGSGHVMRCLTLARALQESGAECHFISRQQAGDLVSLVRQVGFAVHELASYPGTQTASEVETPDGAWAEDAAATSKLLGTIGFVDWIVVDHYRLDDRWEAAVRPLCRRLMAIDDLANRRHDCDLLLDQNVYVESEGRYSSLIGAQCLCLIGPQYALLRPEFAEARKTLKRGMADKTPTLHIFFGGSDPGSLTLRSLNCIKSEIAGYFSLDVVVGSQNPDLRAIQARAELLGATVSVQVSNIAEHIVRADLGLGACGVAALERCSLGLPTLTLVTADNQRELAAGLAQYGAIALLGDARLLDESTLAKAIGSWLHGPPGLAAMSQAALSLFPQRADGTRRVAELLLQA